MEAIEVHKNRVYDTLAHRTELFIKEGPKTGLESLSSIPVKNLDTAVQILSKVFGSQRPDSHAILRIKLPRKLTTLCFVSLAFQPADSFTIKSPLHPLIRSLQGAFVRDKLTLLVKQYIPQSLLLLSCSRDSA